MKKLKNLIIIFIVLLIALVLLIVFLKKKDVTVDKNEVEELYNEPIEKYSVDFSEINDSTYYFSVKKMLDNVFKYVQQINGDIETDEESTDNDKINSLRSEGLKCFKNVLDKNYIDEFSFKDEDIVSFANSIKPQDLVYDGFDEYNPLITDLLIAEDDVKGMFFLTTFEVNHKVHKMLIKTDWENNAYSIFLDNYVKEYNMDVDKSLDKLKISNKNVEKNDFNGINSKVVYDEDIAKEYFAFQKYNLLYKLEKEYAFLDEDYKKLKYKDFNDFKEYAEYIKNDLKATELVKYKMNHEGENDVLMLLDTKNRLYTLKLQDNMFKYSVQLDDYTILSDDYINKYKGISDEKKVQTDIEMFVKMLNLKDYKSAYNLLDESFRNNNFSNVDKFKEYVEKRFYSNIAINNVKNIEKSGNYYVVTVDISSANNYSAKHIEETFIIALGNDTDFKMSFKMK